jgi:hypothetical protein
VLGRLGRLGRLGLVADNARRHRGWVIPVPPRVLAVVLAPGYCLSRRAPGYFFLVVLAAGLASSAALPPLTSALKSAPGRNLGTDWAAT